MVSSQMVSSQSPGEMMTLSEAWDTVARSVKYAIREEQKARLQYLKNTEYGKEYLMHKKATISSAVLDRKFTSKPGVQGNVSAVDTEVQFAKDELTNSVVESRARDRKSSILPQAAGALPQKSESRKMSAVSTQGREDREKPSVTAQGHEDTRNAENEESEVQPAERASIAGFLASKNSINKSKSAAKAAEAQPEQLDASALASSALGGNFGIF